METMGLITCQLNNGTVVLGRFSKTLGINCPITYANRKQAEMKIETLPAGWHIYRGLGRAFYVAKTKGTGAPIKPVVVFIRTTQKEYYAMMGAVPTKIRTGIGFLVGEAYSMRACQVTGELKTTYHAYFTIDERFYDAGPLTVEEFRTVTLEDLKATEEMEK